MHQEFKVALTRIEDRARSLFSGYEYDSLLELGNFFRGSSYVAALQATKSEAEAVGQERLCLEWFLYCVHYCYIARLHAGAQDVRLQGQMAVAFVYGIALASLTLCMYDPLPWLVVLSVLMVIAAYLVGRLEDWTLDRADYFVETGLVMARCIHVQLERSADNPAFIVAVKHMLEFNPLGPKIQMYLAVVREIDEVVE